MNPKNDYLDYEIKKLRLSTRIAEKKNETKMLIKFLFLLIPLLFFGISLHAAPPNEAILRHRHARQVDGGVQFTCKRCRTSQWQDKRQADWRGDYFCGFCGTKMGSE
jgi:hypothetical protein